MRRTGVSLRLRLMMLVGVPFFGMLAVTAISLVGLIAIEREQTEASRAAQLEQTALVIQAELRDVDLSLEQLLTGRGDADLVRVEEHMARAQSLLARLATLDAGMVLRGEVGAIAGALARMRERFVDLVAAQDRIGFTLDQGLRGTFRDAAGEMERRLRTEAPQDATPWRLRVMNALLMVRRYEKDYMLTGSQEALGWHRQALEALNRELAAVPADERWLADQVMPYLGPTVRPSSATSRTPPRGARPRPPSRSICATVLGWPSAWSPLRASTRRRPSSPCGRRALRSGKRRSSPSSSPSSSPALPPISWRAACRVRCRA